MQCCLVLTKLGKCGMVVELLCYSMNILCKVIAFCLALNPISAQAETFRAFVLKGESVILYCVECDSYTDPSYLTKVRSPLPGLIPGDMVTKDRKVISFKGTELVKGGVYRSTIDREDLLKKLSEDGYLPLILEQ